MSKVKLATSIIHRVSKELAKGYRKSYAAALGATAGGGLLASTFIPSLTNPRSTMHDLKRQMDWAQKVVGTGEAKIKALRNLANQDTALARDIAGDIRIHGQATPSNWATKVEEIATQYAKDQQALERLKGSLDLIEK